jgi:integrase
LRKSFTYNGKRYWVSGSNEKEIAKKKNLKIKELSTPIRFKFKEWSIEYLDMYKPQIAKRTRESYMSRLNTHIYPFIGNKYIDVITSLDCQKILNKLIGYSGSTIHKIYYDMNSIFEKAVFNELINKNPVSKCTIPNGTSKSHRSLTEEELHNIYNLSLTHRHGLYILSMLMCGLRPHETALIQGKDIDGNILHIRGTKTENADRYVPIPDVMLSLIPSIGSEEYLFKSDRGRFPLTEKNRADIWKIFKRDLSEIMEVADDLVPYCFRHTYCTLLQEAGVPLGFAQKLMGHSTIALTANIYTHATMSNLEKCGKLINTHFCTM